MSTKHIINPGDVFGRLVIVKEVEPYIYYCRSHGKEVCKKQRKFLCECECGNEVSVRLGDLTNKHTQSCGCLNREIVSKFFTVHGDSKREASHNSLYKTYKNMLNRCYNPNNKKYHRYGGRGITVYYKKWLGLNGYKNFKKWALCELPIGKRWKKGLLLERKDNNANYSPDNCYFATPKTQCNNQERTVLVEWEKIPVEWRPKLEEYRNWTKNGRVAFSYIYDEFKLGSLNYRTAKSRYTKGWTLKTLFNNGNLPDLRSVTTLWRTGDC